MTREEGATNAWGVMNHAPTPAFGFMCRGAIHGALPDALEDIEP